MASLVLLAGDLNERKRSLKSRRPHSREQPNQPRVIGHFRSATPKADRRRRGEHFGSARAYFGHRMPAKWAPLTFGICLLCSRELEVVVFSPWLRAVGAHAPGGDRGGGRK